MKIVILGDNNYSDNLKFNKYLLKEIKKNEKLLETKIKFSEIEFITGGLNGVSKLAQQFANSKKIPTKNFIADWNIFGSSAKNIRDKNILNYLKNFDDDVFIYIFSNKISEFEFLINSDLIKTYTLSILKTSDIK